MRSYQVFASMTPEQAGTMMHGLAEKAPAVLAQAVASAAIATKSRPVYLQRQPFEKRAEAVRRALARVAANAVADEVLAVYFLDCRKKLLADWLDTVGLEHDEGTLSVDSPPPPAKAALEAAVDRFLAVDEDPDRRLLLLAFAAQNGVDWPDLDTRLAPDA
jgi:hypothetical protein